MCTGRKANIFIKRASALGGIIVEVSPLLLSPFSQDVRLSQVAAGGQEIIVEIYVIASGSDVALSVVPRLSKMVVAHLAWVHQWSKTE